MDDPGARGARSNASWHPDTARIEASPGGGRRSSTIATGGEPAIWRLSTGSRARLATARAVDDAHWEEAPGYGERRLEREASALAYHPAVIARALTCAIVGLDGAIVEAEVDIGPGLPAFTIVGMGDTAVQEARERVRSAIRNSGCEFPLRRIIVNLAPAILPKTAAPYDLPIAVGILGASGLIPQEELAETVLLGELALDGSLRHTGGILPMVATARDRATDRWAGGGTRRGDRAVPPPIAPRAADEAPPEAAVDLRDVRGQEGARRALEIAAAGRPAYERYPSSPADESVPRFSRPARHRGVL